jgi:3-deoxy-D-manno-octulosonate 8-phosphate phosphatase KdsC-like HAD superfamily phosphatase
MKSHPNLADMKLPVLDADGVSTDGTVAIDPVGKAGGWVSS